MSPARGPGRATRRWRMVRDGGTAGRFAARARKRRLRALVPLLIVAAVVTVVVAVGWVILGTRVLDVRSVVVEGAVTLDEEAVRTAAAVRIGSPLARVDVDRVRAQVSVLPAVSRVQIYRTWPHTLIVRVTERRPAAVVAKGKRFVVLDPAGVPFRTVGRRPADLPLLHVRNPGPADRPTLSALTVAAALTPELRRELVRITAPTAEQVSLVLAKGRTVFWGDADDSVRKATVATALLARPGTEIDVRAPDVVTVK